jgi:DNA-binding PadR family transcriptional regulator
MSNPFANKTELLVLSLLKQSPAGLYGLELVRLSGGKLKRGTVYLTLGRLEERGLVNSKILGPANHPGLPRPTYSIAEAGEKMLEMWKQVSKQSTEPQK